MRQPLVKTGIIAVALLALAGAGAWFVLGKSAPPSGGAPDPSTTAADRPAPDHEAFAVPTTRVSAQKAGAAANAPTGGNDLHEELNQLVLVDHMPELLERAKTDPAMAYALSIALGQCAMADNTYAVLASDAKKLGSPDKVQARLSELEHEFGKCRGMEGQNLKTRFELVTRAAAAGFLDAQVNYRAIAGQYVTSSEALRDPSAAQEYHNNVIAFTNRAANSGRPDALFAAFDLYSDGIITPPNKVLAYRYLSALAQARPSGSTQLLLANFAATMSPDELRRATTP